MTPNTKRGIGAVLIAFGAIGVLLWLAVARLSPETALGLGGMAAGFAAPVAIFVGVVFLRYSKD